MMARLAICFVISAVAILPAHVHAQEAACYVSPRYGNVNIRNGPGTDVYYVIDKLPYGDTRPATGRSGDWYALSGDARSWVQANTVHTQGICGTLPDIPAPNPPAEFTALMDVPVLPTLDHDTLQRIFEHGQALGNDPAAFTKVGDCNTATSYFLTAFDWDNYNLGPYADLQPTVDYFAGWFSHDSLAGQVGLNAHMILDPAFVDPSICLPQDGEGLLACEYRLTQPAVAVIMPGINDLQNVDEDWFDHSVREIVRLSLDSGIIPVLTTFTWHHDERFGQTLRYNLILVEIAESYRVPLINFWRAAHDLPNYGLMEAYTHLTDSGFPPGDFRIAFNGEETLSGYALRNLLTLQTLDLLRREVLDTE